MKEMTNVCLSVPDEESYLAAELRKNRHMVFKSTKDKVWKAALESTAVTGPSNTVLVLDQVKASAVRNSEQEDDKVRYTLKVESTQFVQNTSLVEHFNFCPSVSTTWKARCFNFPSSFQQSRI
jgi:hypothetical protein